MFAFSYMQLHIGSLPQKNEPTYPESLVRQCFVEAIEGIWFSLRKNHPKPGPLLFACPGKQPMRRQYDYSG
jgi:hypothetical protein